MEKTIEVVPMFNLDFIYYLIYLFFKGIFDFFLSPINEPTNINLINVWKYASGGGAETDPEKYQAFGNGIASLYDGYSLFTPPHGLESFGGFSGWWNNFITNPYCANCPSFFDLFFGGMNAFLYLFILFGIVLLLLFKTKEKELEEKESILYDTVYEKENVNASNQKSERWNKIISLTNSANPNDWAMAIIDADNLLEEVLIENGFQGENIGERLKNANFATLQNAWEAHKVRNEIAHNSNYTLTQKEVKRAIANFERVFAEFYHL